MSVQIYGQIIEIKPPTEKMLKLQQEKEKKSLNPQRKWQVLRILDFESDQIYSVTNKSRAWIAPDYPNVDYEFEFSFDGNFKQLDAIKIEDIESWTNEEILTYAQKAGALSKNKVNIILDYLDKNDKDLVAEMRENLDQFQKELLHIKGIGSQTINSLKLIINGCYNIEHLKDYFNDINQKMTDNNYSYPYLSTKKIHKSDKELTTALDLAGNNYKALIEMLNANPYQLIKQNLDNDDIAKFINFKEADIIYTLTHDESDLYIKDRIEALFTELFVQLYNSYQYTYLTLDEIKQIIQNPKKIDLQYAQPTILSEDDMTTILDFLNQAENIVSYEINDTTVYALKDIYEMEATIAQYMLDKQEESIDELDDAQIEHGMYQFELKQTQKSQNEFRLSEEQKDAIKTIINQPLSILTGYAGTGKSTIVSCAVNIFEQYGLSTHCCAFTGKAAQNLSEIASAYKEKSAYTIHKTIYDQNFLDENDYIKAKVVIVDEISMCPMNLFATLIAAIKTGTRLIILGDEGQLDPVNSVNLLTEFMKTKDELPMINLIKPQRQKAESGIYQESTCYRQGNMPNFTYDGLVENTYRKYVDKEISYYLTDTENAIKQKACNEYLKLLETNNQKDIQIIAPRNADVKTCNTIVQMCLLTKGVLDNNNCYPIYDNEGTIKTIFYVGDRVINGKNKTIKNDNTEIYLANGTLGTIDDIYYDIENGQNVVKIVIALDNGKTVTIDKEDLANIDLAYAITVHKSQGSTIKHVIFVNGQAIEYKNNFVNKKLSYTAITRAKESLIICSSEQGVRNFILEPPMQRAMLSEMIQGEISAG